MVSVVYLTRINFFSDKAHVHTIAKTCEALSGISDITLTFVSTDNSLAHTKEKNSFFTLHEVSKSFNIVSLNSFSNLYKNSTSFFIYNLGTLFANFSLIKYVWENRKHIEVVYFRDHLILPVIFFAKYILHKKVVYESHYVLTKKFGQWLTEKSVCISDGVVAITIALREYYFRFNKNSIVSFCASSDKERFITVNPNTYYQEKLGLPLGRFYLVYTGNIDVTGNGDSYGVEDVVKSLPLMSGDVCFVAVGKKNNGLHPLEILATSLGVSNKLICIPWVSREKAIEYILSSDVLIIPKSGGKVGNSPTKMFEYLGARRPIVAANTTPMKEVLQDGINALLVDYSHPQAWSDAIKDIRSKPDLVIEMVNNAYKDADMYTWEKRGSDISEFIKKIYA
ncbi:MAG: hypothetical protein QG579_92 [Patescibacteria group bacterium]|jgi:glycosyltransferase involved in cell wall biosynthesis|nr:hypothetical protein [Patescibacteria group bacterium]